MLHDKDAAARSAFPVTRWTLLSRLKGPPSEEAAQAMEDICAAYWYPLYVFARRFGLDDPDAKDAVQDVFTHLIRGNGLAQADAERGRLRNFLLTALKNQISMTKEKQKAVKRGGNVVISSLDLTDAEGRYLQEPIAPDASPERIFERKWAMELLRAARNELEASYTSTGQQPLYQHLSPALDEGERWSGSKEAAVAMGMNEPAVRTALHRLRVRYRETLLRHVRATVERDEDVKAEAAYLMQLFAE